jgi:hypothetical protein
VVKRADTLLLLYKAILAFFNCTIIDLRALKLGQISASYLSFTRLKTVLPCGVYIPVVFYSLHFVGSCGKDKLFYHR